jgi:hypothetical protein
MKKEDIIKEAIEQFDESVDAEGDNREASLIDAKFENGEQWTAEDEQARIGRPCLTINKVAGTVKQILGDARQNKPRIKIRPVDSDADPLTAEIFTALIRNIENVSDAESAYDNGHDCAVRGGIGFWRVNTRYNEDSIDEQDIYIDRIVNTQSVYFDQSSIKLTYEDAEHCFIIEDMKRKKFKKKYPKANASDFDGGDPGKKSGWFTKDTVRVAEYWYKEPVKKHLFELLDGKVIEIRKPKIEQFEADGEQQKIVTDGESGDIIRFKRNRTVDSHRVMWCKITASEVIEGPTEWAGKYIPIVPCLGEELWIEGERILRSAIRHAIEPQRLYNWARSNNMETMSLAPKQPWVLTMEQIEGYEDFWNNAYAKPMPYLPYNYIEGIPAPQRLLGSIGDNGANQEAMLAADEIKATTGKFDASLGAKGNETSGRAITARQRQGDTATFVFTDNQTRAVKHTGKILVDLIPKIYDTDRVVRLMGENLGRSIGKKAQEMPIAGNKPLINVSENGKEAWARINYTDKITGKTYNDLSIGKYDVEVDAGSGYATRRQESVDGMIQLGQAAPQFMPIFVPRIAKNSDWPDAEDVADEIKAMTQPQQPPPDPRVQIAAQKSQIDMQKGQLDLQKGQLDLEGKKLDLQGKAQSIQSEQQDQQQKMLEIAQQATIGVLRQIGVIR